jgi:predicted small secreted protein
MKRLWLLPFAILAVLCLASCNRSQQPTVVLFTLNTSPDCHEHNWKEHVCTDNPDVNDQITYVFATEPDCQGIPLRGITEKEAYQSPPLIPNMLTVYYGKEPSAGAESWKFSFFGPNGTLSTTTHTREMVHTACRSAKGLGADIDIGR